MESSLIRLTETSWAEYDFDDQNRRTYYIRVPDDKSQTTQFQQLRDDIFMVQGIKMCTAYPYEIHVTKSKIYKWTEIEPKIKDLIIVFENEDPIEEATDGDIKDYL